MSLRRRRKLILKILFFILVASCIIWFFVYIYPKSNIKTYDSNSSGDKIQSVTIDAPVANVTLPTTIKTISPLSNTTIENPTNNTLENNTNTGTQIQGTDSDKNYESYIDDSTPYLITILSSDNSITLLLSERSSSLIDEGSPTQIGYDYTVSGIPEKIVSVYDFTVDNYKYPIVLLLSESGFVYYLDMEAGYSSGNFSVAGKIDGIPQIDNIYTVTVDNNYKSAVLVDKENVGYEFSLNMINK